MVANKLFIVIVIVVLAAIGCFYIYLNALGSMWVLHKPDKRPYFITTKPLTVKNISLPIGTKITYNQRYFWEKYEQKKPLNEKNITQISFKEEIKMEWGGVPITSIVKFYNPEMKGYSVYADFDELNKERETPFSKLWQRCRSDLGITIQNTDDWSFNKENILDIESCSVNYQRYFEKDQKQQQFLDSLLSVLMKVGN